MKTCSSVAELNKLCVYVFPKPSPLPCQRYNDAEQNPVCYYKRNGVRLRKWRPLPIVVPKVYCHEVISIAHDRPLGGHLGITKTHDKVSQHFWWPKIRQDISEYIKTCHTCQMVGKPNQKIPPAPLKPIPAFGEPFSRVIIDCVGPPPKTKTSNEYPLTIMCVVTRFPEAIPLRNIKAATIIYLVT